MKTKIITLKRSISRASFNLHTRLFFANNKFKTQYIYVLVKLSTGAGQKDFKIGNKMLIDLKNTEQVKSYRNLVLHDFLKINKLNKSVATDTVTFFYFEINRDTYLQQLNETAKAENFNLDAFF